MTKAIKSPRPVKLAFIESLRPWNELFRASAITEPRDAAFEVIVELLSLALSFGARDFFLPFRGADIPADFHTWFMLLSSLRGILLTPNLWSWGWGWTVFAHSERICRVFVLRQKRAWDQDGISLHLIGASACDLMWSQHNNEVSYGSGCKLTRYGCRPQPEL